MAASKKSTPKAAEPAPEDLPAESIDEEQHPVEPVVENPPVEANPDGEVEPGVEQPKTAPDDGSDDVDAGPQDVSPHAASVESSEPTPWRVETYSDGVQYGWRLCAANGNIIRESGTFFDSPEAAVADAEQSSDTGQAEFLDKNVSGTTIRGWR